MPIYYVEVFGRGCALLDARSVNQAWAYMRRTEGQNNVRLVRLATVVDIAHVQSMGGQVHEVKDDDT